MKTDEFLLVKQTSGILGVSANTIRTWAENGELQEYRHPINNYRLFRREDVEALLQQIANPIPQVNTRVNRKSR